MAANDLVSQLNQLLTFLSIDIPIQSPSELTPSLLIAILESIITERLPIPEDLRQDALDFTSSTSWTAKLQCMKIFLGVMESDVLKMDVGLSSVDPRKLANGDLGEVEFIAELLVWIGAKLGAFGETRTEKVHGSPSTSSSATATTRLFPLETRESTTSLASEDFLPTIPALSSLHATKGSLYPKSAYLEHPRNVHEPPSPLIQFSPLPGPSAHPNLSPSHDKSGVSSSSKSGNSTIRYDGFIKLVDHEKEMAMYDRKHGRSRYSDAKGKAKASERSLLDEDDVRLVRFVLWHAN
jgi:hypothetical protein